MQINEYFQQLKSSMPKVFDEVSYLAELERVSALEQISQTNLNRLTKAPTKIQIHWQRKKIRDLYTFSDDYSVLDLISAWSRRLTYVSHYSALYFHELVEQQPKEHYLTQEIRTHSNAKSREINQDLLRQSFMKGYRGQQNYCYFNGVKFFFIEKANANLIGVESKSLRTDERVIDLRLSNVERTLIDSVVAPQYSGGMSVVSYCFTKANVNLLQLSHIYSSMNFLYPYWQTIGFLLEKSKDDDVANRWAALFGEPQMDFYFDRNYRSDWDYNKKWRLFVPKGI